MKIDDVISKFNCAVIQINTELNRLSALEQILCIREQFLKK